MRKIKAWDSIYIGFHFRPFYWKLQTALSRYDEINVIGWLVQIGPFALFGGI